MFYLVSFRITKISHVGILLKKRIFVKDGKILKKKNFIEKKLIKINFLEKKNSLDYLNESVLNIENYDLF